MNENHSQSYAMKTKKSKRALYFGNKGVVVYILDTKKTQQIIICISNNQFSFFYAKQNLDLFFLPRALLPYHSSMSVLTLVVHLAERNLFQALNKYRRIKKVCQGTEELLAQMEKRNSYCTCTSTSVKFVAVFGLDSSIILRNNHQQII